MKERTPEQEEMLELAKNSLSDAVTYIVDLKSLSEETARLFRSGNEFKAQESYIGLVNSLDDFTTFFGCIAAALNLDCDRSTYQGLSITDIVDALMKTFNQMVAAQESYDWVMLADLIEYELIPNLNLWQGVFTGLLG